ncbi:hypothetical protein D9758_017724 [Tetrapyrgos nigripes]|uniref:Uncharacterized protein n=1 Tax=Tetrapyrgos nigripes TaxID=182062 RepID=A0A8H5F1M7_9AGAR|nr:hypothetical protein D9758_017724 [Tetrapyrgos nigripes]
MDAMLQEPKPFLLPKEMWTDDIKTPEQQIIRFDERAGCDVGFMIFRGVKAKDRDELEVAHDSGTVPFAIALGVHEHKAWVEVITSTSIKTLVDNATESIQTTAQAHCVLTWSST